MNIKQTWLINTYAAGVIHYSGLPFSIVKQMTGHWKRKVFPLSVRFNWIEQTVVSS